MAELINEGSAGSKLRNLIKRVGANTDTRIEFGTVTVASPSFNVLIDGMKIEIDADDCVVAERLIAIGLKVGDRVIVAQTNAGQTYVILDRVGAF